MCIHPVPPFCFCLCTPPQLCLCCCIIYQSPSHSFHLPKSIQFISSTNIPFIHFIYLSPSLSYLPYLVMLMLHCHSALFSRYIKKHDFCLNIFIHELISRLMHQSLIFVNITVKKGLIQTLIIKIALSRSSVPDVRDKSAIEYKENDAMKNAWEKVVINNDDYDDYHHFFNTKSFVKELF